MANIVIETASPEAALNPLAAVSLCRNSQQMASVLRMHGIPCRPSLGSTGLAPQRRYLLSVFQHQVLAMMKKEGESVWLHRPLHRQEETEYEELSGQEPEQEVKLAKHWAIRSLYALGLDYGAVVVGAYSPTRLKVLHVRPVIEKEGIFRRAMEAYEQRCRKEWEQPAAIMLGADPEFALRDGSGGMAMASRFLSRHGLVGYDAVRYRAEIYSRLHPIAELRPQPAEEPQELFRHLYRAMRDAARRIKDDSLQWLAGGMPFEGYPIGGHLHFSGIGLHFSLLRKLDTYLALPLMLVEDHGCRKRRPRYGYLGDFREKEHGGFEYRTLPSWLVTPRITKGVFALAKVIVSSHHLLKHLFSTELIVQKAYYDGDKETIRPLVKVIQAEVTALPGYRHYHHELEPFFRYVLSNDEWPADRDIRLAWKLSV
jgi:GNAT superfamily N-acetyltransferase